MTRYGVALSLLVCALPLAACRTQTAPVDVPAGPNGVGTGYTAACNGDFPSWIVQVAPVDTGGGDFNSHEPGIQKPFELAQSYPLGIPIFNSANPPAVNHYDPPAPNADAPWRAFTNLSDATQRTHYLNALKGYFLENMSDPAIAFNATQNNKDITHRRWFHVPMMTAAGPKRREPYHGVTSERSLRPSEQTHWLNGTTLVPATAIGYYNFLGGYTIGQVFPSSDLTQTSASKATFIDGTFVFKLLFAQYDPARVKSPDPLLNSPEWWVQDLTSSTGAQIRMRLLQVDVAVKDDHFPATGWVFATFAYDESLTSSETNPWKRLTPIGIMWGNDPAVTVNPVPVVPPYPTLTETWLNLTGMPAAFKDHVGRAGRLIGPVDDPQSSCLSCHSTAEVDPSQPGNGSAYPGAAFKPPASGCAEPADSMVWFRNLHGGTPFGHGLTCPPKTATAGLVSMDYSLQLSEGVSSVFGFNNSNPCVGVMGPQPAQRMEPPANAKGNEKFHFREVPAEVSSRKVVEDYALKKQYVGPAPGEPFER